MFRSIVDWIPKVFQSLMFLNFLKCVISKTLATVNSDMMQDIQENLGFQDGHSGIFN